MVVADVMTPNPVTLAPDTPVLEAARFMRDEAIGDVLVGSGGTVVGILTDRDIVVRGLAEEGDVGPLTVGELCTPLTVTVAPSDSIEEAMALMERHAVRRLPVVAQEEIVGVLSLGDLALVRDPASVLGQISEAPPTA